MNQLPETAKTITIYNSLGELVYHQEIHKNSFTLSTADWAKGLYSCNIQSNQQTISKKFIVR
ncbi:MAG: T9SS type A sorting domain-containing protein [Bacteroidetes bacterium]|nr:T9SS type A sorting domain-containing protein [Bacteroidota bacterium]